MRLCSDHRANCSGRSSSGQLSGVSPVEVPRNKSQTIDEGHMDSV